ncbi:unnamed protein product [Amoebophrya sp. A25]|nr:unnamed protein product [Amoebophrya sp. A25]|eukprot:GSA25T00011825001.1
MLHSASSSSSIFLDEQQRSVPASHGSNLPCLCGSPVGQIELRSAFVCHLCHTAFHNSCVRSWYAGQPSRRLKECEEARARDLFVCSRCRLKHLDQFDSVVGAPAPARYFERNQPRCVDVNLEFDSAEEIAQKRAQGFRYLIRCVRCDDYDFNGPCWPYSVQLYVNGLEKKDPKNRLQSIISPPAMGHCRKEEVGLDITNYLQAAAMSVSASSSSSPPVNRIRLVCRFYSGGEKLEGGEPGRSFCVGIFTCRPMSVQDIRRRVLEKMRLDTRKSQDLGRTCYNRVHRLIANTHYGLVGGGRNRSITDGGGGAGHDDDDEVIIQGEDVEARSISAACPISGEVLQIPCLGRFCESEHLQCFDLDAFLQIQQQIKNHAQRWRCPICQRRCRPFDLRFCRFTKEVMLSAEKRVKTELALKHLPEEVLAKARPPGGGTDLEDIDVRKVDKEVKDLSSQAERNDLILENYQKIVVNKDGTWSFDYALQVEKEREEKYGEVAAIVDDHAVVPGGIAAVVDDHPVVPAGSTAAGVTTSRTKNSNYMTGQSGFGDAGIGAVGSAGKGSPNIKGATSTRIAPSINGGTHEPAFSGSGAAVPGGPYGVGGSLGRRPTHDHMLGGFDGRNQPSNGLAAGAPALQNKRPAYSAPLSTGMHESQPRPSKLHKPLAPPPVDIIELDSDSD